MPFHGERLGRPDGGELWIIYPAGNGSKVGMVQSWKVGSYLGPVFNSNHLDFITDNRLTCRMLDDHRHSGLGKLAKLLIGDRVIRFRMCQDDNVDVRVSQDSLPLLCRMAVCEPIQQVLVPVSEGQADLVMGIGGKDVQQAAKPLVISQQTYFHERVGPVEKS